MKTLLNNQDAEIATLGSVIIDGKVKVIESQQDILEPGDFYVTKHQKISVHCYIYEFTNYFIFDLISN